MLSYDKLKDRPRDFLAATGLTLEEFQKLLPAFRVAYEKRYPLEQTREGKARQRRAGDGAKGALPKVEPTFRIPFCQFMNKAPHKGVPVTAIPVGGVLSG
jgi:hypothetical protein